MVRTSDSCMTCELISPSGPSKQELSKLHSFPAKRLELLKLYASKRSSKIKSKNHEENSDVLLPVRITETQSAYIMMSLILSIYVTV